MKGQSLIKDLTPPVAYRLISSIYKSKYGWSGSYPTWQSALDNSTGYDSKLIVERVKDAVLKVRSGEAVYERDSVLFEEIHYSWPLLAALMTAALPGGKINVLDFGGALGSTYFQNRDFLARLHDVKWNIVEQGIFAEYGKKFIEDNIVKFYSNLSACLKEQRPKVILFSCVLQYLEKPYDLLREVLDYKPEYIIVDNMPFTERESKIVLQNVPPEIYPASYPCWILNRNNFIEFFEPLYKRVDFKSDLVIKVDGLSVQYEGFIFQTKQS